MRILIVGGGFTALACGMELADAGCKVTLIEKNKYLGGLGGSFGIKNWDWNLEQFYHHIFFNDKQAINIGKKVALPAFFKTPKSYSLLGGEFYQLDSPASLLKFSALSPLSRIRMGLGLGVLKVVSNGQFLEKYRLADVLPKLTGEEAYKTVWKPMLKAKFGKYLAKVNLAWFWARIYKRTQKLGYFRGGFENLAAKMAAYIADKGGKITLNSKVAKIQVLNSKTKPKFKVLNGIFDGVVITASAPVAKKLLRGKINLPQLDYLWGQTLVLELDASLLPCYWLNILEKNWPFLLAVEQTRLVNKKNYGNKHIVYLGNYLEENDDKLKRNDRQLLNLYLPYLKKLNAKFNKNWITQMWKFQQPFAQPVFPTNYSSKIPPMKTKIPHLYMANMSMVYPWDRGVNYAMEMGKRVARMVIKDSNAG